MVRIFFFLLLLSSFAFSTEEKDAGLLKIDFSFDALSLDGEGKITRKSNRINARKGRAVRIIEQKSYRKFPGYVIQLNEDGSEKPQKYWVSKKWLDRALVSTVKQFGELERAISNINSGNVVEICDPAEEEKDGVGERKPPVVPLFDTFEADSDQDLVPVPDPKKPTEEEQKVVTYGDCKLEGFTPGKASLVKGKHETPPQIYSRGYKYLEEIETILQSPASCEEKLGRLNALPKRVSVEQVDDLIILDYIQNNLQKYLSDPSLRALLAATMKRRPIIGSVFCGAKPAPKNCEFNAPGMIVLSNALIKKEVEAIQALGQSSVTGFRRLTPQQQTAYVSDLSTHLGALLQDPAKTQSDSEAFARECDKKVSSVLGKGEVHCTVSGYALQRNMDVTPDGTYFLGGYDSGYDGRFHCYPSQRGIYNLEAELQVPAGGETRRALGCYSGQSFKISIAHERRVGGKIKFGGPGGGIETPGSKNLHTHLEFVLLPMKPRKPGQDYDEWWTSQEKIDPVNVFCRGTCAGGK